MTPQVISLSSLGSTAWIPVDYKQNPFNIGLACVVSNTPNLTYQVEFTLDDIFNTSITPTAFTHSLLVGKTSDFSSNQTVPVRAIRLTTTAYTSGTVTLTALQGGVNPVIYTPNPVQAVAMNSPTPTVVDSREDGTVVYAAAGRNGLTFSGGANTPTLVDHNAGLLVTTPSGVYAEVTFPELYAARLIPEQWTMEIYSPDWSAVSSMAMYIGSVSNFATSWTRTFNANNSDKSGEPALVGAGVRYLHSDFASHATLGSPDKATTQIKYHKLRITPMAGRTATVQIRKIKYDVVDVPSLSLTFDDGYQTVIDNALPVMIERGLRGSACLIPGKIGTSSRFASVSSWLNQWIAAGNECIGHGPNTSEDNLTDAGTIAGAVADMNIGRDFMTANGLGTNGSENIYCWPQGIYTFAADKRDIGLRAAAFAAGYLGARGTEISYMNSAVVGHYPKSMVTPIIGWIKNTGGDETTNITALLAKIDDICDAKKSGTLMFHDVEASPDNGNNITLANFTTLMDRIALRVSQGRLINPLYSQQIKWASA